MTTLDRYRYVDYSHYTRFVSPGRCNIFIIALMYILLSQFWYINTIIILHFIFKVGAYTSVLHIMLL